MLEDEDKYEETERPQLEQKQ